MRDEDRPPEDIWLDEEALSLHFERVKDRYQRGDSHEAVPDPGGDLSNELTRGLR